MFSSGGSLVISSSMIDLAFSLDAVPQQSFAVSPPPTIITFLSFKLYSNSALSNKFLVVLVKKSTAYIIPLASLFFTAKGLANDVPQAKMISSYFHLAHP